MSSVALWYEVSWEEVSSTSDETIDSTVGIVLTTGSSAAKSDGFDSGNISFSKFEFDSKDVFDVVATAVFLGIGDGGADGFSGSMPEMFFISTSVLVLFDAMVSSLSAVFSGCISVDSLGGSAVPCNVLVSLGLVSAELVESLVPISELGLIDASDVEATAAGFEGVRGSDFMEVSRFMEESGFVDASVFMEGVVFVDVSGFIEESRFVDVSGFIEGAVFADSGFIEGSLFVGSLFIEGSVFVEISLLELSEFDVFSFGVSSFAKVPSFSSSLGFLFSLTPLSVSFDEPSAMFSFCSSAGVL